MRSKKAIYNILANLLLQLIMIVYGFVVPKIIISKFGSETNGLISSITQFLAYITLLESGFGPVVKSILYKPIAKKDNNTIASILKTSEKFFRNISYIFVVYIVILCFIYPVLINSSFSNMSTFLLIIIIAISIFAEYFFGMTYRLFLQADQKTYVISIIQTITYIFAIILVIILSKINCSVYFIKLSTTLVFVFRPILQNIYVRKKYNIELKHANNNYKIEQKWDGLAQHIAAVIHGNTDITVLTLFTSLQEVSVYSVYFLVVSGIKKIVQAFNNGLDSSFGDMIAKGEIENLNRKFNVYEILYYSVTTIIFACTILLIVPFVSIYTKGIKDVNYIRYTFGYLIVISEYIWAIRLPYSSLTIAAGHFKETKKGALFEAIINIVLSLILVIKYGIVGVTIGTIVAMTIRTIEFTYHSNKYILKRSMWKSISKIILVILNTIIIIYISNYLPLTSNNNYINWIINLSWISILSIIVVLSTNIIIFKKDLIKFCSQMIRGVRNGKAKIK